MMSRRRKLATGQKKLLADFMANIAVAWFSGGVIGVVFGGIMETIEAWLTLISGLVFSFIFLGFGLYLIKEAKIWGLLLMKL